MKVDYIDHMGTDLSVVNAARVSFHKQSELEQFFSTKTGEFVYDLSDKDTKLIKYLATHKHEIPFAHTAISLRIKAPVFIRTQCFKHKVGFVENEVSRRYVTEDAEFYTPDTWRLASKDKKQGSEDVSVTTSTNIMGRDYTVMLDSLYRNMLKEGVCPEQARMVLPQSMYTEWIWTGNVLSFSRFYNLRTDSHAQKEIQDLARMVGKTIEPLFPISWRALTND